MKRLLTLLVLVLCSCAETFVGEEVARPNNENLPDLTASFADEEATRTYIEEGKYLRWNEDDRLTIFFGNTLNRQYKFNGQTGDNSGTFSLVADGMLGTGNAFDRIYALYPYNADVRISDEGVISLTLPTTQTCAENSFGVGANTMLAVTENVEDTFLSFKNTCGYLKLKLYNAEGATLKSIEVKGNNGERLAGTATVTINYGEAPTLTMAESATDAITLDCGEGVALGRTAEEATELWVVLPATTFAEGLTITVTDAEGKVFKKSTTKEVVIERNAIQPMAILEAKFIAAKPANNEIWYTNGSTTEPTTPYRTNKFGANIVSNTYDVEKECWVIKCDGEVTTIGLEAFYGCSSLTSVTIPDSVTSIGCMVFYECGRLTSITIGDSVTSIDQEAFSGCSSLTSVTIPDGVTTIGVAAFDRCYSLTSVTIPDSVTSIGEMAFDRCSSLTSVTIPDSVTSIENRAFSGCSSLREFNGKYASEDGRCLIMDGTLKSFAPAGLTEYAIPNSVTTIGVYAFRDCSSLTSVTIGDSVTEIGYAAFEWCKSLTSITIPDSVKTIRSSAFYGCSSLTSVYCKPTTPPAGSSYMFYNNASDFKIYVPLESVNAYKSAEGWSDYKSYIVGYDFEKGEVVPEVLKPANNEIWYTNGSTTEATTPYKTNVFGANIVSNTYDAAKECWVIKCDGEVTTIGNSAFRGCSSLTSVTIPDSVTSIGYEAFKYCSSLTSITIPDSRTTIGWSAFEGCSSLTSVTIPDGVTTIGGYAFSGCSSLTSVTIPDSVTSIGERAFYDCTGELIVNGNIPSASYYTYGAFYGSKFTSVTIGDGVTTIGRHAFDSCSSLTSVYISDLSVWCRISFEYYTANPLNYAGNLYLNNELVTDLVIPSDVTEIKNYAFAYCTSLTSVTIPDSVTTIGEWAFRKCSSLTSVTIPDSVTTIGYGAFWDCSSLTTVTIPDSVTTIENRAFYYCSSLTSVYCKAVTPPTAYFDEYGDWSAFNYNDSNRKIYVPTESVEAYKSADGWRDYKSSIVGYDF